jgi:hypothetical protein
MMTKRFCACLLSSVLTLALLVASQTGRAAVLSVGFTPLSPGSTVDLSGEGELDWAHWGLAATNSFDHKDFITPLISDFTVLGTNVIQQTNNIGVGYSWSDGTPTSSAFNSTTAVLVRGMEDGFQVQAPADVGIVRRLKVFVGAVAAQGKLIVTLTDGSAPANTNLALNVTAGETNGYYSINYAADSYGQYLTARLTLQVNNGPNGDVRLHAAALQLNAPPYVILNSPTNEAVMAAPTNLTLNADAYDFDVNGYIQKVEFFTNGVLLAAVANEPYTWTWTNAPPGAYDVTAVATGADGEMAASDPATIFIYLPSGGGALTASVTGTPATTDLTAQGTADWAHWGLYREYSFNHKLGVASQIGNYHFVVSGPAYQFNANTVGYTWTDGSPTVSATATTTGVYITDVGDGFEFTVPADVTTRTLKVYLGAYAARGRMRLHLSDGSAAPFFDSSVQNTFDTTNAVYTISFKSGSTNQTLTVHYTVAASFGGYGNVTLHAATLVTGDLPPYAAITNLVNQSVFLSPTNLTIRATASDADGTVSKVGFFDGTTKLGEDASSPYEFVLSNAPAGSHSFTARATDDQGATYTSARIDVFVTIGGGSLSGRFAAPPALADLSALGRSDWAHWGLVVPSSFNHRMSIVQQISSATKIGSGQLQRLTGYPTSFSWTDGTPTLSNPGSDTGVFITGLNRGFQITAPADTTKRRLRVYAGLYASLGRLEASLSDASAVAYVDQSLSNIYDNAHRVYTIDYAAASSNKTLTIKYTSTAAYDVDYGNVTLEAAALAPWGVKLVDTQKNGSSFSMSFISDAGEPYAVEYSDILPATNWTTLTNLSGDGSLINVLDPAATSPKRFYRLKGN